MAVARKRVLDMTNVKEKGAFSPKRKPEGDYLFTITGVTEEVSKSDNDQWVYALELEDDPRAVYPYYCVLDPDSFWKIRNLLVATGIDVPKKRLNVDPNKIVGEQIGGTLEDDEYEGREKSKIAAVFPADEIVDDTPAKGKVKASAVSKQRKAKVEEPESDDDDEELDEEPEPAPKRRSTSAARKATSRSSRNRRATVKDEDIDDEDLEALDLDEL